MPSRSSRGGLAVAVSLLLCHACGEASVVPDAGQDLAVADLGADLDTTVPTLGQPCSPESPCNSGEQCAFDRDGDWWCIPIGLAALDMGCTAERTSSRRWSLCMAGLSCDLIVQNPERLHPIVCRPGCTNKSDCDAGERCVDAAAPGLGGLCRASECDYDGVVTTLAREACMAWEFLGADQADQDVLVPITERVRAGEPCEEPFAFCGQHERLGVCDSESVCRRTCRGVADCAPGEVCAPATVSEFHLESFDMYTIYSSQDLTLSTCQEAP